MAELSETAIRRAQPKEKRYTLADRDGLILVVGAKSKTWYHRRMESGKAQSVKLGEWPTLDLAGAREIATKIKQGQVLMQEVKPVETMEEFIGNKKSSKITMDDLFKILINKQKKTNSESHIRSTVNRYHKHVQKMLGEKLVTEVEYRDLKNILKKIEKSGKADTGHKITIIFHLMFNIAKVEEIITPEKEQILTSLEGIITPKAKKPLAAITGNIEDFRELVRVILTTDKFATSIKYALSIAPFVALRPNELTGAKWEEINLDSKEWVIPAERMKGKDGMRTDHLVPLPEGVCAKLKALKELNLSEVWVFPQMHYGQVKNLPISTVSVGNALVDLGYKNIQTAHGFRACFRTYASEFLEINREILELQLHHNIGKFTPNGLSYNRVTMKDQRRQALQDYETFITPAEFR